MRKERLVNACFMSKNDCFECEYCSKCPLTENENAKPYQIPAREVFMSLCAGRHEIPAAIDGSVFDTEINPLELEGMEMEAEMQLLGVQKLNLYVTGLTVALVAVLNVCREQKIKVTLYHYNRETGDYYPQEVK